MNPVFSLSFVRRSRRRRAAAVTAASALLPVLLLGMTMTAARAQTPPPPPPPPVPTDPALPPPAPGESSSSGDVTQAPTAGNNRYLLLPDISFIGLLVGHTGNDRRDPDRDKLRFDEGELALQSFVYPGIGAQVFIVFSGDGEAVVEEAYLNAQNLSLVGLNNVPVSLTVGRRKVPFGRVNQLHPHSWLYTVQPYVLSNLVSGESLTGDGASFSYLLPTGKLFAQLDAGFWSQSEATEDFDTETDPSQAIVTSPGAGFKDKFGTVRLWTAAEVLGGALEIGGSIAGGRGVGYTPAGFGGASAARFKSRSRQAGGGDPLTISPRILLSGVDLTYRRTGLRASRLLLRGEYLRHRQKEGDFSQTAEGYYVFADQRFDAQNGIGLRYDWSEFPYAPGLHESAVSLIGTHQFTEQFYARVQLIQGERPGKRSFTEAWFQLVFGFGPHTHTLE